MTVQYRKPTTDDAEALTHFLQQLDDEAEFILFNQGERKLDVERIKSFIEKLDRSVMLIAIDDEQIIRGYVFGEVSKMQRLNHVMKVNIGVLKAFQHTRVTYRLTSMLYQMALTNGIERGEATVIQHNQASLAVCLKMGFVIEGVKKKAVRIGNELVDEICLAHYMGHPPIPNRNTGSELYEPHPLHHEQPAR